MKTLEPEESPSLNLRISAESYGEVNGETLFKLSILKNWIVLNGIQFRFLNNRIDQNKDGFTDVGLKQQITSFHQITFQPNNHSRFQFYIRPFWEERWGGEMEWTKTWRGSDSIYGENIITRRIESILHYESNLNNYSWKMDVSSIIHEQDSWYGTHSLQVRQRDHYLQTYVESKNSKTEWLIGGGFRYFIYDDNTFLTSENENIKWYIPFGVGSLIFPIGKKIQSHLAIRYDYHPVHHSIITPRLAFKWRIQELKFRIGATSGFRVINLFTEDHAALTGARQVVIPEKLKPERSYSVYMNLNHFISISDQAYLMPSITIWRTLFLNRIMPDYSNPDKILYQNLHHGYAINQGISIQMNSSWKNFLQGYLGFSLLDNLFLNQVKRNIIF